MGGAGWDETRLADEKNKLAIVGSVEERVVHGGGLC